MKDKWSASAIGPVWTLVEILLRWSRSRHMEQIKLLRAASVLCMCVFNCSYCCVGVGGDDDVSGLICRGYSKNMADRWQWQIYQLLMSPIITEITLWKWGIYLADLKAIIIIFKEGPTTDEQKADINMIQSPHNKMQSELFQLKKKICTDWS